MPGFHPSCHARTRPDQPAMVIADTGEVLTYRELDEASNRMARLLRSLGLKPGDRIAVMLKNSASFPIVYWGATRSGLFITLLSTHLKPAEAAYIVNDSASRVLVLSAALGETPRSLAAGAGELIPAVAKIYYDGHEAIVGAEPLCAALAPMPAEPVPDEISGFHMIYSSGTTGRPKGIVLPFTPGPIDEINALEGVRMLQQGEPPPVVFNAGPLYHGMPLSCMVGPHRTGGTAVNLSRFDAEAVLMAIETWKVTEAQFVPTMFVRLLRCPTRCERSTTCLHSRPSSMPPRPVRSRSSGA
jgi:fatty-acyl-CoA synthase